ncbi:MAG: S41 family peptidase [Planctomycetota bacterium]|jgi:carboxyl-terminal processing protease
MWRFGKHKHRRLSVVLAIAIFFLAFCCKGADVFSRDKVCRRFKARLLCEKPESQTTVDRVCEQIAKGDFKGALHLVRKSAILDSKALEQLAALLDEYMAINAKRQVSKNEAFKKQIDEFERLRCNGVPEDVNDINKVLSVVVNSLEYADNKQKKTLIEDSFIRQTIDKAKTKAAEFEMKGKWFDAYKICYSKIKHIYKNNKTYCDYAQQLRDKADIQLSFQDSSCQSLEERYAGVKKQTFINVVDILDSSYVNIIDYHQMAVKGLGRCKLLSEVISNPYLNTFYNLQSTHFSNWGDSMEAILRDVNQSSVNINKNKFVDIFEKVLALNQSRNGGIEIPHNLLIAHFAEGALSALDPYTVVYWPSQVQDFKKAVSNQFQGIGIKFTKEQGLIEVVSVLPNTPAYECGLKAGDIIKAVDGILTSNMSRDCAVKSITGPEGTEVTLTIVRAADNEASDITLNRAKINVPSVQGLERTETDKRRYMIDERNGIGYVQITSFDSRTAKSLEDVLCQLEAEGLKGLILDLRSNPGGLLDSAVEIADKFISRGLIVRTQPRFGMASYESAQEQGTHPDRPLVILVNHFTASASEIVAGALQDPKYNRAVLVGERTYGKGSVQTIATQSGTESQLKYTMAYYHLPSGQRVESKSHDEENWGISPDVTVKLRSDELRKLAGVQRANQLSTGDYLIRHRIDADPQLAIGLLVLKSKMIQSGHTLVLNR